MRSELRMAPPSGGEQCRRAAENGSQPALCGKTRLTTPMSIESYRGLEVWPLGRKLTKLVYQHCRKWTACSSKRKSWARKS